MGYKKIKKFKSNKENPFIEETMQHIELGSKQILMGTDNPDMIVGNDGEVKGHAMFMQRKVVDKAQFSKVFIESLPQFFGLSKSGIKMFSYVMSIVKPNQDSFYINYDDCMSFTGYKSQKTIITGMAELLENKFIARGQNPYHFYINPTIFFNGDRITFVKQFQLKSPQNKIEK